MLADMLMEVNRPGDALVEYEKSMDINPNRFDELYGAGRAAELLGEIRPGAKLLHTATEELRWIRAAKSGVGTHHRRSADSPL
jgi:hypothetical protein